MAMKLCAPVIGGPVSTLSTAVFVSNCVPGATVFVRSLTRPGTALVKARINWTDGFLPLEPGEKLQAGDQLVASQSDNAGSGSVETDPKLAVRVGDAPVSNLDMPPVDISGRLWECGLHAHVGNASPGLTVEILRNGAVIGSAVAQNGIARINLTKRYGKNDRVKVRQGNGGVTGPDVEREVETLPVPWGSLLPPPVINSDVRACASAIRVDGVYEGAEVTVSRKSGETATAGFDLAGLWFNLAPALTEANGWVKISQAMPGCERQGQDVTVNVGPPQKPTTPFVYPLCAGMTRVGVDNVQQGHEVRIRAGGDDYLGHASARGFNGFDVAPLAPGTITVQVFACGLGSDPVTVTVEAAPAQIDTPAIVGELVKCQRSVPVEKLKPGAIVQVWSKGPRLGQRPISAQFIVHRQLMDIPVTTLIEDADVWAVQWACQMMRLESPAKPVRPAPLIDDPFFPPIVTRLDASIEVAGTVRDAIVEILRLQQGETWVLIGLATATAKVTRVPLNVTLAVGERLKVRQRYCAVQSPGNRQTTVVKPVPLAPRIITPRPNETIMVGSPVSLSWQDEAAGADADRKADSFDVKVLRGGTQVLNLSQAGTTATLPATATASFSAQYQLTVTPRNATGAGPSATVSFRSPKAPEPVITAARDGDKIRITGSGFAASRQVDIVISTQGTQQVGPPPGSPGSSFIHDNRWGYPSVTSDAKGEIDYAQEAANVLEPRTENGQSYKAAPWSGSIMRVTARNRQPIPASLGSSTPSNTVTFNW